MCDRQITEWSSSVTSDRHNYQPTNVYMQKKTETEEENSDAPKPEESWRKKWSRKPQSSRKKTRKALQPRRSGTDRSPPPGPTTKTTRRSTTGMIKRFPKWAHAVASQSLDDTIPQNKEKLKVFKDLAGILNRINRLPHWAHMMATQAFDDPMTIDRNINVIREIRHLTEFIERIVKKTEAFEG